MGCTPGRFILGDRDPGNHLMGGSVSSPIRVFNTSIKSKTSCCCLRTTRDCHIPACSSVPMRLKYTGCYANSISQIIEVEHLVLLREGTMSLQSETIWTHTLFKYSPFLCNGAQMLKILNASGIKRTGCRDTRQSTSTLNCTRVHRFSGNRPVLFCR